MGAPHDVPTAAELLAAVRSWLDRDVANSSAPPNRFQVRVAANILAIVGRELELGAEHERRHDQRLRSLGVTDDGELVAAIRSGSLDARAEEVRDAVWASVRDKLAVANPGYLERVER
jgi:hypothetical protein